MSNSPEKIIEEIESGSESMSEPPSDDEMMSDIDNGLEEMGFDLASALVTEDGDTLCSALVDINNTAGEIAKQLATTNKILIKMLTKLN